MEFHLPLTEPLPNLDPRREALHGLDPAAVVDTAIDGRTLRIATTLGATDVARSLRREGLAVTADQLVTLPSVCCGGCSG